MKAKKYVMIGGRPLVLSNLDKVFYPSVRFTKRDVIRYYQEVSPWVLPHLKNRLFTLKRYPNGVEADSFYQKQVPFDRPKWVETYRYEGIDYVLVNELATLIWVVNLGAIELHTTLAAKPYVERPLQVVFDLDPGQGATLRDCASVALLLRESLRKQGLKSFVKTSGSKGIHVNVPLNSEASYAVATPWVRSVAEQLEKQSPEKIISRMSKKERVGKVFIDWSQNVHFKTTACVYSLRAAVSPMVSCPLDWSEVKSLAKAETADLSFDAQTVLARLKTSGDLYAELLLLKQSPKATQRAA